MKRNTTIGIVILIITSLSAFKNTQGFMCSFEGYEKSILEKKIYTNNTCFGRVELKGSDYKSFEFWEGYGHDKNHIYTLGEIRQDRIDLDFSFSNFYKKIIYTKKDTVYYKNQYKDLIEITKKGDNLKVLYDTNTYLGLRSNTTFLNIRKDNYGFHNIAYKLNTETGCNISSLEYINGLYFDGKNVCGYAYPVPKKIINIVENKINKELDNNYTRKVNRIHNHVYQSRNKLVEKMNKSDSKEILDKYLFVGMEYILEHIDCKIRQNGEDLIGCKDINRRNHIYPR